jgi:hypothetical protein
MNHIFLILFQIESQILKFHYFIVTNHILLKNREISNFFWQRTTINIGVGSNIVYEIDPSVEIDCRMRWFVGY